MDGEFRKTTFRQWKGTGKQRGREMRKRRLI